MEKKENKWGTVLLTAIVFIVVTSVWVISWAWIDSSILQNDRGVFGDKFGAVNALFSGLAFAGVIITIYLQSKELRQNTDELRGQKNALSKQLETMELQQFESSFFQLMSFHHKIVEGMENPSYDGRGELYQQSGNFHLKHLYYRLYNFIAKDIRDDSDAMENLSKSEFLIKRLGEIGHYFRNMYHIVKFIDNSKESINKKMYIGLLRAQLSSEELALLFYNCTSEKGLRFKPYVEKYALLHNMDKSLLFDPKHEERYDKKAFGENLK